MARYDTAVGKYVYVTVDDLEYRVYFEESGSGIPLMLQHTAGSDAREWRHLLENPDITDNYRVIAYDLPYHGKSLPPLGKEYWKEEYRLERDFFMKFILALKNELELDKPVFMGCSMG
ncbi:MAG: alpha/beta fold hydrolase, partial [Rhodospirillales bacterium]|nr:alpha/beta fold hydrolase [Rhodospirillales bacterium]